jgi:hypothetical protein
VQRPRVGLHVWQCGGRPRPAGAFAFRCTYLHLSLSLFLLAVPLPLQLRVLDLHAVRGESVLSYSTLH